MLPTEPLELPHQGVFDQICHRGPEVDHSVSDLIDEIFAHLERRWPAARLGLLDVDDAHFEFSVAGTNGLQGSGAPTSLWHCAFLAHARPLVTVFRLASVASIAL